MRGLQQTLQSASQTEHAVQTLEVSRDETLRWLTAVPHHSTAAAAAATAAVIDTFRWILLSNYIHPQHLGARAVADSAGGGGGTLFYLLNCGPPFNIYPPPSLSSLCGGFRRYYSGRRVFVSAGRLLRKELCLGDRGLVKRQPIRVTLRFCLYYPVCKNSQQHRSSRKAGAVC